MTDVIDAAVAALNERLGGRGFDATAKFVFDGAGAIMLDAGGARAGDKAADVTLIASAETFEAIFAGELSPTGAFFSGRLRIEGDMGLAMKLGSALG